jgi:hypothetical protein
VLGGDRITTCCSQEALTDELHILLRHRKPSISQQVPTNARAIYGAVEACQPWAYRLIVANWPELRIPR